MKRGQATQLRAIDYSTIIAILRMVITASNIGSADERGCLVLT